MLNVSRLRRFFALVLLTALTPFALAIPQAATLSFSHPAISGSFGVKIDSTTQKLVGITSVSLTIDGYKFKPKDIGFRHVPDSDITYIAGLPNGLDVVSGATSSDFFLVWRPLAAGGYAAFITYTSGSEVVTQSRAELIITPRKN